MMNLAEKFQEHVKKENLFSKGDHLIVACSGGLDSVVLAELCRQCGFSFSIAHCNFNLRENESERDENFTRNLAQKLNVTFHFKHFDTTAFATANKMSIQEAARALRYSWFEDLVALSQTKPTWLLTAHHADDNVETIAMHFFRGTGLHGLTGIPLKTGYIRRPLLPFTKEELLSFAKEHHLDYVEDSSNTSSKYTRNFFRNDILPAIATIYPQVMQNLQKNITRFKDIEALYRTATAQLLKKLVKQKGEELHVPVLQLLNFSNDALIYELIHPFGFSPDQAEEVKKLAKAQSGSHIVSATGTHRIIRHRSWFIIAPVAQPTLDHYVVNGPGKTVFFNQTLSVTETESIEFSHGKNVALLDAGHIEFPLLLRKWKTGDYFYPLGMRKKKKISRFLIDQRLSKTAKENTWVVESKGRILWVVAHRIDDRFKIIGSTKLALKLELSTQ